MAFSLIGTAWNILAFIAYLVGKDLSWADSVTIHHTGSPNLRQRSKGLIIQHIKNIHYFYTTERRKRGKKPWSAGPHLFVDDIDINGMSSLEERGVHAVSFNRRSIAIEVLGNYDSEDPKSGRGLKCWKIAAQATAALLIHMGKEANEKTIHFHRDDPKTSKSCPGTRVKKEWFIALVLEAMREQRGEVSFSVSSQEDVERSEHLMAIDWQVESAMKEAQNVLSSDQLTELEERFDNILWRAEKLEEKQAKLSS